MLETHLNSRSQKTDQGRQRARMERKRHGAGNATWADASSPPVAVRNPSRRRMTFYV